MPFCPKCKYEYKEGFTVCSDCGVELVDSLEDIVEENLETVFEEDSEENGTYLFREEHEDVKTYVNSSERADNYKSGAGVLIVVGLIGAVALILINLHILPINLPQSSGTLINIVMGALFVLFIIVGINSYMSYKKLSKQANDEDTLENRIDDWVDNVLDKTSLELNVSEDDSDEIKYFNRIENLRTKLTEEFPDMDASFKEHILEDLYDRIFG